MIVSGGENVFPKEVEDCLARHEAVAEVAAIGVDDDDYGKRLRGVRGAQRRRRRPTRTTLKDHVKENLARYKVPREIVFLDELPRNATGKVLKKDLKDDDRRRRRLTLLCRGRLSAPSSPGARPSGCSTPGRAGPRRSRAA